MEIRQQIPGAGGGLLSAFSGALVGRMSVHLVSERLRPELSHLPV